MGGRGSRWTAKKRSLLLFTPALALFVVRSSLKQLSPNLDFFHPLPVPVPVPVPRPSPDLDPIRYTKSQKRRRLFFVLPLESRTGAVNRDSRKGDADLICEINRVISLTDRREGRFVRANDTDCCFPPSPSSPLN